MTARLTGHLQRLQVRTDGLTSEGTGRGECWTGATSTEGVCYLLAMVITLDRRAADQEDRSDTAFTATASLKHGRAMHNKHLSMDIRFRLDVR